MNPKFSFRRATHNLAGEYVGGDRAQAFTYLRVCPLHWMGCNRGMTFDEIASAMQNDRTNFQDLAGPAEGCDDRSMYPTRCEIAIGLVAMLEHGLAEIVPAGWANEARK